MNVQLNGIWARTYRILRVHASSIHQQRCPVHVHMRAISPRSLGTRDTLNHCHQQHDCHSPSFLMTPHLSGLSIGTLYGLHARGKHCWTIYVIFRSIESLVDAYRMVIFPRLHTNNCLPKILQIFQGPRHRRIHSRHTHLTWHTTRIPSRREAPNRCLDRIDTRIMSRDTDGSSYVRPNTNP